MNQQHHQRPRPAVRRPGLHKGQHNALLYQPALNFAFENWRFSGRTQSFAVDNAYAAPAHFRGIFDEVDQCLSGVLAPQLKQYSFRLSMSRL